MESLAGSICVVTGAASGIGLHTALELAEQGGTVALLDVRQEALDACVEAFAPLSGDALSFICDVTSDADLQRVRGELEARFQRVDILVNNAGTAVFDYFETMPADLFDRVMAVNFGGAVKTTRYLLPLLRRSKRAQLVNVASIGAFSTAPGYSSYGASKYALRAFSEALSQEFPEEELQVLTVFPGGIRTGLEQNSVAILGVGDAAAAADETRGGTSADSAGKQIVRAIRRRRRRLFIGVDAKLLYLFERAAPGLLLTLMGRWVRRASARAAQESASE